VERLKDRLARYKKSSKNTTETPDGRNRLSVSSTTINLPIKAGGDDVCEICERPGHDIFNCSLLKEDVRMPTKTRSSKELFCQDCEGPGHTTADCPHSLDVF
jgi:CAP-Gly domain-containing linker protein 1